MFGNGEEDVPEFSWIDYTLFSSVLLISALVGVYFGFFGKKQDSREEYMHGGRSMKILPIAFSLIATEISGITILAVPTDVYLNGTSYLYCLISTGFTAIVCGFVTLPVFFKIRCNSSFEYLKRRYDNSACVACSAIFLFTVVAFMPIVIYIPALAFSQVSGINLNIVIPIVCIICIFYTTIGGIKAVVWTDTIQMIIMLGSLIAVITLGILVNGGFVEMWNTNWRGQRIDLNLDPDPTSRTSSIAVILGFGANALGYSNNPIYVQRFLAVKSYKHVIKTLIIFTIGSMIFRTFSVLIGMVIYAKYADCDPITAGLVSKPDQILPYYVMDVARRVPGLSGLFIAGIFSAALSTMSSGLNTLAGTIYEDFLADRMPKDITEKRISDIMKLISVLLGLICMVFVFLVQYMGGLFQLTMKVASLAGGPILAMFLLGMLLPFVNTKGILWGILTGFFGVVILMVGSTYYDLMGMLKTPNKPLSIAECPFDVNGTAWDKYMNNTMTNEADLPPYIFRITFFYYAFIGAVLTMLVAIPLSLWTGGREQVVDEDLLSPVIYRYLKNKNNNNKIREKIHNELQTLNVMKLPDGLRREDVIPQGKIESTVIA